MIKNVVLCKLFTAWEGAMKNLLIAIVCGGPFVLGSPAIALEESPLPVQVAPAPPAQGCGSPPLAVGNAVVGGEILARAGETAIKRLPNLEVRAGGEIVRSAYAGMRNQAMATVLEWYRCRIDERLVAAGGPDLEERREALLATFSDIGSQFDDAERAAEEGGAAWTAYRQQLTAYQRPAGSFTLPRATFASYFADVNPSRVWIDNETLRLWVTAGVGKVSVVACGGVIRKAISDGGSQLQAGLGSIQPHLGNYLNPTTQPRVGLTGLVRPFTANPVRALPAEIASFEGCAKAMAEVDLPAPPTDPAGPAVPPPPAQPVPGAPPSTPET